MRDSLRAMRAAWERGVNFFDTARSYGFGEAESVLGRFLSEVSREQVVLATKFGIRAARSSVGRRLAKGAARHVLRAVPSVRALVKGRIASQFSSGMFDVGSLRASLDESLRSLGTDYVDVLYLHAAPLGALEAAELFAELRRLKAAGTVRAVGISSTIDVVAEAASRSLIDVGQFDRNVFTLDGASVGLEAISRVANQPFGGVGGADKIRRLLEQVRTSRDVSAELREKLFPIDERVIAEVAFGVLLQSGADAIVCSMFAPSHVEANVAAVAHNRFTAAELEAIRTMAFKTRDGSSPR